MNYPTLKSCLLALLLIFTFATLSLASNLSPALSQQIENGNLDSLITVVVVLDVDAQSTDLQLQSISKTPINRSENIKRVLKKLTAYEAPNQNKIEDYLSKNSSTPIIKHWIIPAYTAQLTVAEIAELAKDPNVQSIIDNVKLSFESPIKESPAPFASSTTISNELQLMNVPTLWNQGIKGKGSLICSFDTGVEGTHPALASKWRGNHATLSESWFSKVLPTSTPFDATGHGTHTMGIMIGSMEADSFGVAPEAEWISAGVIDQGRSLSMTISDIIEAFQWALNPDGDIETTDDVPDVILNSWGIPKGLFLPCDDTFWGVIDNVEAAGVVTIFAVGNEGPEPMTIRSPADRATTPLNSFSVGAVDLNRTVANFSSRGPSSCDPTQIKPEVVAPGVNIRSATIGGGFKYMSGTSMAAPYIAGSVALIRQYNKNATVDQIKNAFIQAATDLGSNGEDNAYGNGFVDLASILQYIPIPEAPEYQVSSYSVTNSTYILPGESIDLRLTLTNPSANVENATGEIITSDLNSIVIQSNSADFFFGIGGTVSSNVNAYELTVDSSVTFGTEINMQLLVSSSNTTEVDTVDFTITVGVPIDGHIATHYNNKLQVTVSDFGLFGFAEGSSYNLAADGFRYNNSQNLLYETGLIIGRSALQMSTSIRSQDGSFKPSDFAPVVSLGSSTISTSGDESYSSVYDDSQSDISIPIEVKQETIHSNVLGEEGLLIVKYRLYNKTIETLSGLYLGLLHDFDLSSSDRVEFDSSLQMIYQYNDNGMYVGVVALENMTSYKTFENIDGKTGFSKYELMGTLSNTNNIIDNSQVGDLMFITSTEQFSLRSNDSIDIAFAYVCGNTLNELYENAATGKEKYDIATGLEEYQANLPKEFELAQNYPNPFNPTTTIKFSLPTNSNVKLEIFNVLGQKVRTLVDQNLPAGEYGYEWDATDEGNQTVASGIYFYRLSNENKFKTQKMTLLK